MYEKKPAVACWLRHMHFQVQVVSQFFKKSTSNCNFHVYLTPSYAASPEKSTSSCLCLCAAPQSAVCMFDASV